MSSSVMKNYTEYRNKTYIINTIDYIIRENRQKVYINQEILTLYSQTVLNCKSWNSLHILQKGSLKSTTKDIFDHLLSLEFLLVYHNASPLITIFRSELNACSTVWNVSTGSLGWQRWGFVGTACPPCRVLCLTVGGWSSQRPPSMAGSWGQR